MEEPTSEEFVDLVEFLESQPPGSRGVVQNAAGSQYNRSGHWLKTPELHLHCPSDKCRGLRVFHCTSALQVKDERQADIAIYVCRNCKEFTKTFALHLRKVDSNVEVLKIGEWPPFGPPIPARVITMIGPDRELFLKGRRAENQGLGLGAFAYYRRVVENQWQRIASEIVRVAESAGAPDELAQTLRNAQAEAQFSKAVNLMKETIPESLKINGHNPISLLYSALSEGIHAQTDRECLELASSIRIVLTELSERIGQALNDDRELRDAVQRLLNRKNDHKA